MIIPITTFKLTKQQWLTAVELAYDIWIDQEGGPDGLQITTIMTSVTCVETWDIITDIHQ